MCTSEFLSKRSTAKFCTPYCRLAFHRKSLSVSVSVSKRETSVTSEFVITEVRQPMKLNPFSGKMELVEE